MHPTSKVEALLVEREGYVVRGLKDRVAQVDAELEAFGLATGPDVYPSSGSQKDVLAYVTAAPDMLAVRVAEALEAEVAKGAKARTRLISELNALLTSEPDVED